MLLISYLYFLQSSRFSIYFAQFNLLPKTENKILSKHQYWWRESTSVNRQALFSKCFNSGGHRLRVDFFSLPYVIIQASSENIISLE